MTKEERQYRIDYEIIVDAYDDHEVNMGWYYYYNDDLQFPITATAKLKRRNGKQEEVEIQLVDVASEPEEELKFGMVMTMQGFVFPISLLQISSVDTTDENLEMLNDWLFWKDKQLL